MQIHGLPIALDCCHPVKVGEAPDVFYFYTHSAAATASMSYRYKLPPSFGVTLPISTSTSQPFAASSSKGDSGESFNDGDLQQVSETSLIDGTDADGIEVEIEKLSNSRRRIRSKVAVDASLQTLWGILTDYERLADFIPGLVVSQVLDKKTNFARLLQIGQQNLAFGLKFNAKGIVDCYEKDYESLPHGERRDIEFKMIEGDFELFEGKWSIEQSGGCVGDGRYHTTLSYTVDVKPKMWLPVQLVEGRLSREIKMNLFCIQQAAQKSSSGY